MDVLLWGEILMVSIVAVYKMFRRLLLFCKQRRILRDTSAPEGEEILSIAHVLCSSYVDVA